MITIRPSEERGHANHGWLDTKFSFSFSDYHDPRHMGFRDLRVINEDRVSAGKGFGMHPHRDMEILTYVIDGELTHRDSMGRGATLKRHDVQRMSAGTGIMHSEVNQSKEPVHLMQIWILPWAEGLKSTYEDRTFTREEKTNRLRLIASERRPRWLDDHQPGRQRVRFPARQRQVGGVGAEARPSCLGTVDQRRARRERLNA